MLLYQLEFSYQFHNSCVLLILDTHALIHFNGDNTSAIVPINRLKKEDNLTAGQQCSVIWSNKKKYPGVLMCSGTLHVLGVIL